MELKIVKSLSSEQNTIEKLTSDVNQTLGVRCTKEIDPIKLAAANIVSCCFAARTYAHFQHLMTNSYSKHKALEEFYNQIVILTDKFAETFQGRYGLISSYPYATYDGLDSISIVAELNISLDICRNQFVNDSILSNILDEIQELCSSTNYKLTNLQ